MIALPTPRSLLEEKEGHLDANTNLLIRNELTQLETIHTYLDEALRINLGETD